MFRKLNGRKVAAVAAATAVAGSALFVGGVANAAAAKDIPIVTKVAFHAGNVAGGEWVSISGSNFLESGDGINPLVVKFGAAFADNDVTRTNANPHVIVVSDSRLLAKVPANGAGIYRVTVQNSKGISLDSKGDAYGYIASPVLTGLRTAAGDAIDAGTATASAAGGTVLQVVGTDLQHATKVTVDGVATAAISKRSKTTGGDILTVKLPALAPKPTPAPVDIVVTTPAGTSTVATANFNDVTVVPVIRSLSVKAGPAAGGTTLVITGTGFTALKPATPVKIGTVPVANAAVLSDTEMVVTTAASMTVGEDFVVLVNNNGSDVSSTVKFKVTA